MLNTSNKIRLANIIPESIVDGPGLRMVIFTQGCHKRCPGCHNPETLPLDGGKVYDLLEIVALWRLNPIIRGITISGGEPFIQPKPVAELVRLAKIDGLDVMVYSGYYYEQLRQKNDQDINYILDHANYLVDGPFVIKKKSLMLLFRGSSNQRYIDLAKTIAKGEVITIEE